jgi:hypothetical protein
MPVPDTRFAREDAPVSMARSEVRIAPHSLTDTREGWATLPAVSPEGPDAEWTAAARQPLNFSAALVTFLAARIHGILLGGQL